MPDSPAHLLLVEDETPLREAVAERLADSGFEVTQAESGEQALERLATQHLGEELEGRLEVGAAQPGAQAGHRLAVAFRLPLGLRAELLHEAALAPVAGEIH